MTCCGTQDGLLILKPEEGREGGREENPFWGKNLLDSSRAGCSNPGTARQAVPELTRTAPSATQPLTSLQRTRILARCSSPRHPACRQATPPAAPLCSLQAQTPLVASLGISSPTAIRTGWAIPPQTFSPRKEKGPLFLLRNVYCPWITRPLHNICTTTP